jgi:hypothetical protein
MPETLHAKKRSPTKSLLIAPVSKPADPVATSAIDARDATKARRDVLPFPPRRNRDAGAGVGAV